VRGLRRGQRIGEFFRPGPEYPQDVSGGGRRWTQQLIALGLRLGIPKRELFETYYWEEFLEVARCLCQPGAGETVTEVGAEEF
jgi:hypothetical protein